MAMEKPSRRKLYSEEKREAYPLEQTKTTSWCRCCAGCAGAGSCTAFCGRKLAGKAQPKAGAPDGAAAGDRRDHGSGRCDLYVVTRNDSVLNFSDLQVGSELTSDYIKVFEMWEVHEKVISNLDLDYTYTDMASMLSVTNTSDTRMLDITVTNPDPEEAAAPGGKHETAEDHKISGSGLCGK